MPTDILTTVLLAAAAGYLLGSIPFGLLLTWLAGLGDIRSIGSGNIGATNVLRTGNKALAAATLLLDGGKGAAAVLLAGLLLGEAPALAAAAGAMLGHSFPVWLGFKGGKGVATALGILLAAAWPVGLSVALVWLLTAYVFRISSLAALVAAGLAPLLAWALAGGPLAVAALFIAGLIFIRHEANIRRLLRGEEPRIGGGKRSAG
ncbi:MAG: glycerol-3-phosphate 1-O-acyltransferase PlsY [Rhodospirillaceae bacterium]